MKAKILLIVFLSFYFYLLSSQVPQGFNYQAIARNGSGDPIINTALPVRITIQSDSLGGTTFWIEEHSSVITNSYGLFTLIIGTGLRITGSTVLSFNDIDWKVTPKFIKTEINYDGWKNMGTSRLWTVPYSTVAGDLSGAVKKLVVVGETSDMEEALFEVKNKYGKTVFAVYNEGVRIYVDDGKGKSATKGGFAIGGFNDKNPGQEYFRVTRDSTRVYVDDSGKSATKGGFAIGGFNDKTPGQEYLRVTSDSVKVSKSLLIPRLTTHERDSLPFVPGEALIIFNLTEGCMQIYKNNVWSNIWCFNCAPDFIIQPVNNTICSGNNVNFFLSATGTNLNYQWQESPDNGNSWNNISNGGTNPTYAGARSYSFTISNVPVGYHNFKYRCIVAGPCLPNITSNAVTLNVGSTPPIFTLQPANQQLSTGCTANFNVASPGYSVSFKWQQSADGGNTWNNISDGGTNPVFSGSTTSALSLSNVPWSYNNYKFHCIASNLCGSDATSSAATLTIAPSSIVTQPTNRQLSTNCDASFSITTPAGYVVLYQWQASSNGGSTWANISNGGTSPVYSGVTTSTLNLSNVPLAYNNYKFRCVVSSLCGPNESSSAATLTIAASSIVTQPTSTQLSTDCNASFSISTSPGYVVNYQWQVSSNGGSTWSNVSNGGTAPVYSGATTSGLSLSNVPKAFFNYQYRCIVSSLCGPNETSTAATLTANSPSQITVQPSNQIVYAGYNIAFSISTSGTGLSYQWLVSSNGGSTWSNVANGGSNPAYAGANTTNLSLTNVPLAYNNYKYRCIVSHYCHPDAISNVATLSVPTPVSVTDYDGNSYSTVGVGSQLWMASNLKTTKYNDGIAIPLVTDGPTWAALTTPGYCWYNNDAATYKATYGAMYNWHTVNTGKLCPSGWHVPTDAEWHTLILTLDPSAVLGTPESTIAGGKLKETGTTHWGSPNTGATNEIGFTFLPGGNRNYSTGAFGAIGTGGYGWSSTQYNTTDAWVRQMWSYNANVSRGNWGKTYGASVRCVKD
jgi:uncharacterized protein (TIGR02145 family)